MGSRRRGRWPLRLKIIYSILTVQLVLLGGYGAVNAYGQYLHNQLDYDDGSNVVPIVEETFQTDADAESYETLAADEMEELFTVTDNFQGRTEEGVYNILLLGEDNREDEEVLRGNTDSMIVASIDTNNHTVKLISFMRDLYVQIPGYSENRLNSAYATGGIQLLYEAFRVNFDLVLDGYVMVNFVTFTDIIDELGGVTITLNEEEAEYLNESKTILDKNQRNVVVGEQHMSGAQALGYARTRYVGNNDYERTQRQRVVLTAIFEEFRSKSLTEMVSVLETILPYIKTDLTYDQMLEVAGKALGADLNDIESYRIPLDDTFKGANIRGMSVLVIEDWTTNINAVYEYIFSEAYILEHFGDINNAETEEYNEYNSYDGGGTYDTSYDYDNSYDSTYDSTYDDTYDYNTYDQGDSYSGYDSGYDSYDPYDGNDNNEY